jgi:hypothetical protein
MHRQLFSKSHYLCRNDPPAVQLLHAYVLVHTGWIPQFYYALYRHRNMPKNKIYGLVKYSLYFNYSPVLNTTQIPNFKTALGKNKGRGR